MPETSDRDHAPWLERLLGQDEHLVAALHDEIIALSEAAVPGLLGLLTDQTSRHQDSPGAGWTPLHAVDLLVELKAETAIAAMLDALERTNHRHALHDRILERLPELGSAALEPALARLPSARESLFASLVRVLSSLGVRDERVYDAICVLFSRDAVRGAAAFARYGDARALTALERGILDYELDYGASNALVGLSKLVEAHDALGRALSPRLRKHVDGLRDRFMQHLEQTRISTPSVRVEPKVGRNDACPCGSGKKHKKCCLKGV